MGTGVGISVGMEYPCRTGLPCGRRSGAGDGELAGILRVHPAGAPGKPDCIRPSARPLCGKVPAGDLSG